MRYALLYNPVAGRGRAVQVAKEATRRLQDAGHSVVDGRSQYAGHMEALGAELGAGVDRLLVLGGDGSLRETVKGLLAMDRGDRPAVGALPFGNGNVMAREAGLSMDTLGALDGLMGGAECDIDLGFAAPDGAAEEPFLAMVGAGYDAAVADGIDRARRTRLGGALYRWNADIIYGALGLREMVRLRPPRFGVDVDGETLAERAAAAVVTSVWTYGKGMSMAPKSAWDDGLLGVHVRSGIAPWKTGRALWAAQRGRPAPGWAASNAAGRLVTLRGDRGSSFPWQIDGDAMGRTTSVAIRVEARSLRFLAALDRPLDQVGTHDSSDIARTSRRIL